MWAQWALYTFYVFVRCEIRKRTVKILRKFVMFGIGYNKTMAGPTKKQKQLLKFIQDFTIEHDYSPSYREIQRAMGLKSVSAVAEHVDNCVKAGYLKKTPNAARTLEVIPQETHEETQKLIKTKIAELEAKAQAMLAEDGEVDVQGIKDDIATLKAAAKLLGLAA